MWTPASPTIRAPTSASFGDAALSDAQRRRFPGWSLFFVAGVAALGVLFVVLSRGPTGPVLLVYGDSLTVQSKHDARQIPGTPEYHVIFRAKGGTAMCDWIRQATKDRSKKPVRIVLAFTGNSATCVRAVFAQGGVPAAVALYEKSLRQMRAIFPTVPITIVIPPAVNDQVGWYPLNGEPRLVAMYERVGPQLHMYLNTDADSWLTPNHIFVQARPDPMTGKLIDVRLSDGVHLTPAGARWYGAALLETQTGDRARSGTRARVASG